MPRTINEGFRDFHATLTPSSTETDGAKRHRASIEQCLISNFDCRGFRRIGSFGNGTSISGYSDVDYLAELPTKQLTQNSTSTLVKVRLALDARFPNTGVGVRCPAVRVPFGSAAAETTEVVPADRVFESDGFKVYEIADCADGWRRSSPGAHNAYVRSIDSTLNNKVKPLIRFIKAWRYFRSVPIRSFYLELRVANYASGEAAIVYDIDVLQVFRMLWNVELTAMQDPMGISGYIGACPSEAAKEDALSKLERALNRAEKARAAVQAGRIAEAFDWWRLVFADQFPTYYR